jgi:putative aldouronate transport system permease protein
MKLTRKRIQKDYNKYKYVYIMALVVVIYYFIFYYIPMYGVIIAFKDYRPRKGIMGSEWIGLKYFIDFFTSHYFVRLVRNTFQLSLLGIIFGFPAPILLALMINEVPLRNYKRFVQTITYMPHFISIVVVCGLIIDFTSSTGAVSYFYSVITKTPIENLLGNPVNFKSIYVLTDIWQYTGFSSIIYLAAIAAIDPQIYEAAIIDGANRWKQIIYITLPSISSTIIILLILRLGRILTVGFEKVMLLYSPRIYETADVISTFVYRKGLLDFDYSYSAAVGLFNSLINCFFLILANNISKMYSESSLW